MLGPSLRIQKNLKYPQWGQAPLPPELLDNLAIQAYKKSKERRTNTARQTAIGKWTDKYAGRQAGRWLDYAAHNLQNIGQALQPPELLDKCKLV